MTWLDGVAGVAMLAWLYLLLFHDRFWRCTERLAPPVDPSAAAWPAIAAVVPARNEEETIVAVLDGLVAQDYPGALSILLVDDHSTDQTRSRAQALTAHAGNRPGLTIVSGEPLPPGWAGKLWALHQGIAEATRARPETEFYFFTDADIVHSPHTLRNLVGKAAAERCDVVSLMAKLHCSTAWERLLIPAFVFFFQMLYPFPSVNDPRRSTAAAGGGCVLIRRTVLERIGGIAAIRGALIDDCALAKAVKRSGGRLWLGLADDTRSLRVYRDLSPIWMMVARSAFTQLRYSVLILLGTILGMLLVFLAPPLLVLDGALHAASMTTLLIAGAAWLLMGGVYLPTLRYYRQPAALALSLPVAAVLYMGMTLDSARRHWWGSGSRWKGRDYRRHQAPV